MSEFLYFFAEKNFKSKRNNQNSHDDNKDNDETLSLIEDFIKTDIMNKKIGDIRYDYLHYTEVEKEGNFDKYTIEEYLVLYKISKLVELNIISQDAASIIKELFSIKLKITKRITELETLELFDKLSTHEYIEYELYLPELYKKIKLIDEVLNKYHLIPSQLELKMIFEKCIKDDDYSNCPDIKDLNNIVRRIKK